MNLRKQLLSQIYFKDINFNKYSLENMLIFCKENVEYYKKFKGLELRDFPVLTKEIIAKEFNNLQSFDINKRGAFKNSSGGSTGEPVVFMQDMEYLYAQRHITYEQKSLTGYNFGEPLIKLWGNDQEILTDKKSYKAILKNYLKNIKFLNSYKIPYEKIHEYIYFINKNEPKLLVAYVESIYQLAKFAEDNDIYVKPLNAVMTSAGTLYPNIKKTIERVFQTKVFNRYGSREVGNIASTHSYDKSEMIVTKGVYLEVIDENGNILSDGMEGELLVTSLVNYSMPLIRYNIGDRGIIETDGGKQILTKLTGRTSDIFKTSNGSVVHGEYFSDLFYYKKWVFKYQVIQKEFNYMLVKIATKDKPLEDDINHILIGIKKVMGASCKVEFEILDDIPQLKSGKFRYTISQI